MFIYQGENYILSYLLNYMYQTHSYSMAGCKIG